MADNKRFTKTVLLCSVIGGLILLLTFFLYTNTGILTDSAKFGLLLFTMAVEVGLILVAGITYVQTRKSNDEDLEYLFMVHNPEIGFFESVFNYEIPFLHKGLVLFSLLMMIFIPLMFASSLNQIFFAGIPTIPQQITESGNILYNSLYPAIAENIMGTIAMGFMLFLLFRVTTKLSKNLKFLFWIIALIVIPYVFGNYIWGTYHNAVYHADNIAKAYTIAFGIVGAFLTIAIGSFIPWFVLHLLNNLFATAYFLGLLGNPFFIIIIGGIELSMIGLFFYSMNRGKK